MNLGSAYYPEHWPADRLPIDTRMMRDAGLSVVRLAEFAWTLLEPRSGVFDFAWLDRAVEELDRNGIAVIMGTPTAAPPKWLMDRHPEVYPVDRFGRRKGFGHRNYYTVNAPALWLHVDRLVEQMAARYKESRTIIGWQIDNEIGGAGSTLSYGELDRGAFIEWLRTRYTSIDELNDAWGAVFSNQRYGSFEEVIVPAYGAIDIHNPGLELDFRRFSSDAAIEFIQRQRRIIKRIIPDAIVTTNFVSNFFEIDYFSLARSLDVTAIGSYPNCNPVEAHRQGDMAFYHDAGYGFRKANYWMLEHQSGTPGSTTLQTSPQRGDIGRWSAQSLARGSDIILYFRWRTCVFGVEQYWHGILPHSGRENSRLRDVTSFSADVRALLEECAELESAVPAPAGAVARTGRFHSPRPSRPQAKAAVILSYDNAWIFDVQPHFEGHRYGDHVRAFHRALTVRGVAVDVIAPSDDLNGYQLVIAPNLAIVDIPEESERLSRRIESFVKHGGHFVCDFRSGTRTHQNQMLQVPPPGPLAEILGLEVEEYGIIEPGDAFPLDGIGDAVARAWFEEVELFGAEPLATYRAGRLEGMPAVTRNRSGSGAAWYLSTVLDDPARETLFARICGEAGVSPVISAPRGVEAVIRHVGRSVYLFLINHTNDTQSVTLPPGAGPHICSEGAEAVGDTVTLETKAYAFVQVESRNG